MAQTLAQLSAKYNKALIYVEANGIGEAILSHLTIMGRVPVYFREKGKPGWWSTGKSKAEAIADAIEFIREGSLKLYSPG